MRQILHKSRIRFLFIAFIFSIELIIFSSQNVVCGATPNATQSNIQRISSSPLPLLLNKARHFYENKPDSAIIYYTATINRYHQSLPKKDQEICLKATLELWEITFFYYFDYSSAFEALAKAREICNNLKIEEPRISLYYGCMYHTVFEQTNDRETGLKSFKYFNKAFDQAIKQSDVMVSRMAFGNITKVASKLNIIDEIKDRALRYEDISAFNQWEGRDFDLGLYKAEYLISKDDFNGAIQIYTHLLGLVRKPGFERYRYATLEGLINSHIKNRQYSEALSLIQQADTIFYADNLRDGRLLLYHLKAICYDSLGNSKMARHSMANYAMLKDSLLNYSQVATIKSIEFIDEIREFDRQLTESRQKRQRHLIILTVVTVVLIIVGFAWFKLRRKTKALESANQSLYRRNQELLHLEADVARIREAAHKSSLTNEDNMEPLSKYKGSTVTDDMRESLWNTIVAILDHSHEIYDPDFSLDRLAELCESKPKYVSQIINEKGDNFKTLINTRRIHQACRNMSASPNLTIEAVANNVGFRSTNAFRSSFRRITGLSPSQYIQLSNNQKHSTDTEE